MTNEARLARVERILGTPPCAVCRDWPADLDAFFLGADDPWRPDGDPRDRHCPPCRREPPVTRPLSDFMSSDLAETFD